jgi:hypothetical protein
MAQTFFVGVNPFLANVIFSFLPVSITSVYLMSSSVGKSLELFHVAYNVRLHQKCIQVLDLLRT